MAAAVGAIFVKRLDLTVIPLQAWIGLFSWPPLLAASLIFESGQIEATLDGGWLLLATIVFTVVLVNIFGHGAFLLALTPL